MQAFGLEIPQPDLSHLEQSFRNESDRCVFLANAEAQRDAARARLDALCAVPAGDRDLFWDLAFATWVAEIERLTLVIGVNRA